MAVETRQLSQLAVGLIGLCAFSWFYSLGGRKMKALRRYAGSSLFCASCFGLAVWSKCFSWWMVISWPALVAALCTGYGADELPAKIRRRAQYGLFVGVASAPFLLSLGLWHVLLFQIGIAVVASVFFGSFNPTSAVGEEGFIGTALVCCWPFVVIR